MIIYHDENNQLFIHNLTRGAGHTGTRQTSRQQKMQTLHSPSKMMGKCLNTKMFKKGLASLNEAKPLTSKSSCFDADTQKGLASVGEVKPWNFGYGMVEMMVGVISSII